MIAKEYLTPTDATCLTLCERTLLQQIGTSCWPHRKDNTLRKDLLKRLTKDLPHTFFCHYCTKLHPSASVGSPSRHIEPIKPLFSCPEQFGLHYVVPDSIPAFFSVHRKPSSNNFKFCHLALAMQRHYLGPRHGLSTDDLAFTEVQTWDSSSSTLMSVDVRIDSEQDRARLLLQVQNWVVFHHLDIETDEILASWVWICYHIRLKGEDMRQRVKDAVLKCKVPGQATADSFKCQICKVDITLEGWDCGEDGTAIVITRWFDLGEGLELDDPKWRGLVRRDRAPTSAVVPGSWGIRRAYLGQDDRQLDLVTERNKIDLDGVRYQRLKKNKPEHCWIVPRGH